MRSCALVVLCACSGGTASVSVNASASTSSSTDVTGSVDEAPKEHAPEDVETHLHEAPSYVSDVDRLYVEITSDGDQADLLHKSATNGLGATPYVVEVADGADLELHMEVASLTPGPGSASCKVKIFVMRLPQHDLLAIADGGASATGHNPTEQCLSATSTAIVRDKLPPFFHRRLEDKQ
jgi:hypothetical protein